MSSGQDILVSFRRFAAPDLNNANLERFAQVLKAEVAQGLNFHVLIAGDVELRRLNRQFREKDGTTDVLSFPSDVDGYLGDIAISWRRAAVQANEFGHGLDREIEVLMLHGVLHLLGMDHEKDRGKMARAEARWRERLGLPRGLIERARA
ncbi:MAG: rRNA maturation RNase YbeY [Acidobacteriota bacterium]|nr:rRNA maturation RNase YbeY [Acidobacteriota bacterium]